MTGRKFSLTCLILIVCAIKVQCETTGRNSCGTNQVPCDDSSCIQRSEWCDVVTDCPDESDEKYCRTSGIFSTPDNKCDAGRHFTCKNRMCIPKVLVCDGYKDCGDNSDEKNCDSPGTGSTVGLDTLYSSSSEPTQPSSTEVPAHLSTAGFSNNVRTVEPPANNFYGNRWAEGENTQRPHYNPPSATASAADPMVGQPEPSADPWNQEENAFGNLGREPWPEHLVRGATVQLPTREPCDKTMTRPDDDPTTHYRVPWSHFVFESSHGGQIRNQQHYGARRAMDWLQAQRDSELTWGANTPRALVALALGSDDANNLAAEDTLQRRLRIDLGAKLIKWRADNRNFSTSDLALYINALMATCQDPRNFFERDLVELLHHRVTIERSTRADSSPFPYLTLCLADKLLTEDDRRFLLDIVRRDVTDEISKDKFILSTSALACLKKTTSRDRELDRSVDEAFHKLQQQQLDDGSFGSVYSTALAAQALIAIDSQSWNPQSTLNYLSSQQRDDGSFGTFLATYYALPVLNGKCLLHLRNIQCPDTSTPAEPTPTPTPTPTPSPEPPRVKRIRYRLATEKPYKTLASLDLVVPEEYSFFDIMKKAQDLDRRFRFHSVEHEGKIDVYHISGIPNDPEFGLFWILYQVEMRDGRVVSQRRYTQDIRKLIPEDLDEVLFYYVRVKLEHQ